MLAHRTTLGAWLDATVSAVDADADNLTLEYDDDSIEAVPATSCLQVPSRYGVGQAVVARMTDTADAEWLAGTICDVQPDGSYSVQYEDGDIDTDVPSTRLRAPACGEQGAQYSVGDRTLGRTPGGRQWFAGQVTAVHPPGDVSYCVAFDGIDAQAVVFPRSMRPLGAHVRMHMSA